MKMKMKTKSESEENLIAARVGIDSERFTPNFTVISVSFALIIEGDEQVLSIQRSYGGEVDESETLCIVLSPSQQCAYDPFTKLVLSRNSLLMNFKQEAADMFQATSINISFTISDELYTDVKMQLDDICKNQSTLEFILNEC